MANIIQTRIKLRNDTLANWEANSGAIIQQGEVALGRITEDQIKEGSGSKYEGKESFLGKYEIRIGTSDTSTWASLEPGNLVIPADNVEGLLDKLYEYQLVKTADGKIQFQRRLPGVETWENVGDAIAVSSQYFEGEKLADDASDEAAIARILATDTYKDKTPRDGDTFVLKTQIGTTGKYQLTAFTRDGGAWKAMDGNYDARNVYFDDNLIYTAAIGALSKPSGSAEIAAKGKSLKDVLSKILAQEQYPEVTHPSLSATLTVGGSGKTSDQSAEAGTSVTLGYSSSFSAGSYTYGPATGVTATNYTAQLKNGSTVVETKGSAEESATSSNTFTALTLNDGDSYTITVTAAHTAGATPVTNTGSDATTDIEGCTGTKVSASNSQAKNKPITASSKSGTTKKITGYLNDVFFGGISEAKYTASDLKSNPSLLRTKLSADNVSGYSTYTNKTVSGSGTKLTSFKFVAPSGTQTLVIAAKGSRSLTGAFNDSVFAEMKDGFNLDKVTGVKIPGAGSNAGTEYTVWTYSPASSYSSQVKMSITLA